MKTPPQNSDFRWENLLRQARADVGPPADLAALLRAVGQAPIAPRENWLAEFSALFSSGRFIPSCLAAAAAFAVVATWQVWDSWQTLPWVQLLDLSSGGAS
jgi:hypothetical protein